MYDLRKIIIMGNFHLKDQTEIEAVVMQTDGMKIEKLLYLNRVGIIGGDKKSLKDSIKSELYSDSYDDDLQIKIKECINGEDAICKISKFITKNWDENTMVYFYEPTDECFDYLKNRLMNINNAIYLEDYMSIFGDNIDNDIYTIMEINNLKTQNLIKDNKISMVYFLGGLIEKLFSK